ncbi:tetratricopeptide repeat protein [Nannocystaceae bacterium ST9]
MISKNHASLQVIAEHVHFSGEVPSDFEREAARRVIEPRLAEVLDTGIMPSNDVLHGALTRLFSRPGMWIERPRFRMACVEVDVDNDLFLPLDYLVPPNVTRPVVIRCELSGTKTVAENPSPRSENGRIVVASSDAGGPLPDAAVVEALHAACQAGLFPGFVPERDHVRAASTHGLDVALEAKPDVAVLQLVCHVRERGLVLHDEAGDDEIVGADALASTLAPFADRVRLVILTPIEDRREVGRDPGRAIVEVALALHRKGFASIVAPRVPLPATKLEEVTSTLVGTLLGDAQTPPASLEQAVAQTNHRLRLGKGLSRMGLRIYARAADGDDTRPLVIRPYRGLLSFEREHARFYIGREKETLHIVARIAELERAGEPRFVMLVGASGVGKSSLAKAGVAPAMLAADPEWVLVNTRPSEVLEMALVGSEGARRLIVVDQLEEVITDGTGGAKVASAYLQRLWALAGSNDGSVVVATLRIDALNLGGDLMVVPASEVEPARALEAIYDSAHTIFIKQLETEQLAAVIGQPATHVGLTFDPGLVDRLCTEALTEPGALPMLELVLDRLWTQRRGRVLSADAYQGGLAQTLAMHANECLDKLSPVERHQGKRILIGIATGADVELATSRRRSTIAKLRPFHTERQIAFDSALHALTDGRLVVSGDAKIEFAHELLLRQWSELAEWIRANQPRIQVIHDLDAWVEEWRQRGTLLTSEQLGYAAQVKLDEDDLSVDMVRLLGVSRRFLRQRRRLRRIGFLGAVVVSIMLMGLSYVAVSRGNSLEEERDNAREQTRLAEQQTELAEDRLDQAVQLARVIIKEALPKLEPYPQVRQVRKDILERLQGMLGELGVTEADTEAQREIMIAHDHRGDEAVHTDNLDIARREFSASLRIAESLATVNPASVLSQSDLSVALEKIGEVEAESGDLVAARILFLRSLTIAETLTSANPHNTGAQRNLSISLARLGEIEVDAGDLDAARSYSLRSLSIVETLALEAPSDVLARNDLSDSLEDLGDIEVKAGNIDAARSLFLRSLKTRDTLISADPSNAFTQDLSVPLDYLGNIESDAGNIDAARSFFLRSLAIRETFARDDPSSAFAQRQLSVSLSNLGNIESDAGNLKGARKLILRSVAIRDALSRDDPSSIWAQRDLSISLNDLGSIEAELGNLDAARLLFLRSIAIDETIALADISSASAQRDLSVSLDRLGSIEIESGNLNAARILFLRSLAIVDLLARADPTNALAQRDLSVSLDNLGNIELMAENLEAARQLFLRSLAIHEVLAATDLSNALAQRDLSVSLDYLANTEVKANNLDTARALFLRSLAIVEKLADDDPSSSRAQRDIPFSLDDLGNVEVMAGNFSAARTLFLNSFAMRDALSRVDPSSVFAQNDLALSLLNLGEVEVKRGNINSARKLVLRSLAIRDTLAHADPSSAIAQDCRSQSLETLGEIEMVAGDLDSAREHFLSALTIREALARVNPSSARASFDILLAHIRLIELAIYKDDIETLRAHLDLADALLDSMDSEGQIAGDKLRESKYDYVKSLIDLTISTTPVATSRTPPQSASAHAEAD